MRVGSADVAEQGQLRGLRGRLGHRQRHAEDRVGAQPGLVRRAVEIHQGLVDQALLVGAETDHRRGDLVEHRLHSLLHTLAQVARSAVAKLDSLVLTGGGTRGHRGAGDRAVQQTDLDLDGRVPPGIEDFAGSDLLDDGHWCLLALGDVTG